MNLEHSIAEPSRHLMASQEAAAAWGKDLDGSKVSILEFLQTFVAVPSVLCQLFMWDGENPGSFPLAFPLTFTFE